MNNPIGALRDFAARFAAVRREHEAYLLALFAPTDDDVAAARVRRATDPTDQKDPHAHQ